jgi:chromosome segregation ATPase
MDINQAARMIEWLDEERRRDKAMIATLEERLAQQQDTISTLTKRLGSIESDQSTMRSQFVPSGREGDLLDQVRKEIQQMIDAVDTKRLTAEREAERRSELAREGTARSVRELTEKISKLERQSTEMPAIAVERDRLAASVAALQQRVDDVFKKLEDPDRRLAFLEEQRRQDARRISEAQSEVPELQKQIDSIKPKLSLIEDLALRTERRMQDIQNGERERREQIQAFIDQQTLLLQQRDQQINELVAKFGEQDSVMTRNIERFETWAEAYRGMKKIIDDFERIGDRLERRINEVAEMQRLSEERFRQEWNDWTGEDQKRWKQFMLSNDEVWRSHDKEFERFVLRLTEMQQLFAPIQESVDRLWRMERERAKLYRETYQALLLNFDTGGSLSSASAAVGNGVANGINTSSGG